jgi:hypothetical protein
LHAAELHHAALVDTARRPRRPAYHRDAIRLFGYAWQPLKQRKPLTIYEQKLISAAGALIPGGLDDPDMLGDVSSLGIMLSFSIGRLSSAWNDAIPT